jgi:hypothetical protein
MRHTKTFERFELTEGPEKSNQKFVNSPRPEIEPAPQVVWNKRTAFNRDLTTELTDVCDRFLRHIDPEDIEQALIELSHKYGDMK